MGRLIELPSVDTWPGTEMAKPSIKVGLLFSQTGVTSIVERTQLAAALLAIARINQNGGINGQCIEPVTYDPASSPHLFQIFGQRLLEQDKVSAVFGCYMSSTRRAVLPDIERSNALLCYPTFYEGFECSDNVLYFGSVPNQTNFVLSNYMLEKHGHRVYLIGSDYIFPRETNRLMRNILHENGAVVLGETYVPLDSPRSEFDRILQQIRESDPDFIFSTVVGSDVERLYRAFAHSGLDALRCPIASVTTTEAELKCLPDGCVTDHITAAPYFSTVETAENRHFVRSYREEFAEAGPVNMCAEASYNAMTHWAEGVQRANDVEPRAIIRALEDIQFSAPQGVISLDSSNNHHFLHSRIGRGRYDGQFDVVWESSTSVKPEPYLIGGNWHAAGEGRRHSVDATVDGMP